ncbi:MAG: ATP-binding protein [Pontiellaceae bacterium]|jgi:signal transduction histidine kinase|nr:ATP-binding protein [Pontiellaceae bacterium]
MELRDHQFLSFFKPETDIMLMQNAEVRSVESGAYLLREGEPSTCLYLILEGSAAIRKNNPNGSPVLLGYVQENDFLGEFGLIDNAPRCADAQAVEKMRVATISREIILKALHDPVALFRLAAHTIHRMRSANQRHVEDMIRQERMSLLGGMVSGILHDFRNPFAVISMASECILNESAEAWPYCDMISQQIQRMTDMAEDIMDFSRGQVTIQKELFKVEDLLERFRHLYEEYFSRMSIKLVITPTDLCLSADFKKLLRVLQNLAGNAAQAMKSPGGTLILSACKEGQKIVLSVTDNGPGIPKEIQHNLFDAFSTSGKKEGVGIGLAVVHSIVTEHNGTISFETNRNCGTTFFIRLPA